jgi:hypothetical protein
MGNPVNTTIRVKQSNVATAIAAFGGGKIVSPPSSLNGGCTDPGCCIQHSGVIGGEIAVGIELPNGMSGSQAHKRLRAAGIVGGA